MAPGQKLYPRATVKRIIKAESDCNVSKDADVTVRLRRVASPHTRSHAQLTPICPTLQVFVDYIRFLQTVVNEAAIESKRAGEKGITPRSVKKVTADSLAKFKL
ncbi:hypothetical protein RB595_004220 [Gaeumannomyces hyphopodioides]